VSTVSAIPAPTAIYREDQLFAWWIYALLAATVAATASILTSRHEANGVGGIPLSLPMLVGLSLPSAVAVGVLKMTTEVTAGRVDVWFGWIPTFRRAVAVGSIRSVEVVSFRPIADYAWGLRAGRDGERLLHARGNRGVRLVLIDGTQMVVGSQQPEILAASLERAMRPGG